MTQRKKPKARGCWYLLDDAGNACWRSLITAKERAKRIRNGSRYAFMIPADRAAAAVVRAYERVGRATMAERQAWHAWDASHREDRMRLAKAHTAARHRLNLAVAAVEKMQRKGKR